MTRNSPGRTGADLHLLGADDGIRTHDPNLGKVRSPGAVTRPSVL